MRGRSAAKILMVDDRPVGALGVWTYSPRSFGESALNLTAIFENAKLGPCFAFGQMWMST